jgi:CCR4-NOT transcription complex subunit 2
MFLAASHFSTGLGDYGQSNQQVSGSSQPQTGSIDEFPPLGRESSLGQAQERRGSSLLQNNAFGGYGAGMAFAGMTQQQRSLMSNALDRERMASPASSGMGCE